MDNISEDLVKKIIINRPLISHKGNYGRVLLIGGFDNYHGAILMASKATVYSGAGLVTTLTTSNNVNNLNIISPEVMAIGYEKNLDVGALIAKHDIVLIGPGLGLSQLASNLLKTVLANVKETQTLIIDGSALTMLASEAFKLPKTYLTVLTPHQMEWQRISSLPIEQQTVTANQKIVDTLNVIVVLKKYHSVIYQPQQKPAQLMVGGPYQATGGMGDTLAGIIAGFLAQFTKNPSTVQAATFIHSKIADNLAQHQYVVLPTQIISQLPNIMKYYSES